jgi:hypothetical protein
VQHFFDLYRREPLFEQVLDGFDIFFPAQFRRAESAVIRFF